MALALAASLPLARRVGRPRVALCGRRVARPRCLARPRAMVGTGVELWLNKPGDAPGVP